MPLEIESPLSKALDLGAALESHGVPYAIGGALAYGLWGIPRATSDVDINVFVGETELAPVFSALTGLRVNAQSAAGNVAAARMTASTAVALASEQGWPQLACAVHHERTLRAVAETKREPTGAAWHYKWNSAGMLRAVTRPDGSEVTFKYDALARRVSISNTRVTRAASALRQGRGEPRKMSAIQYPMQHDTALALRTLRELKQQCQEPAPPPRRVRGVT